MKKPHLEILRCLLSVPTAPFREEAVVERVRQWARRRGVGFRRDAAGNVLLSLPTRLRTRRGGWVFAAHMDHPGFVARRRRGRTLWADFIGSVDRAYFPGARVRFFWPGGEVAGTVRALRPLSEKPWLSCRVELDAPAPVPGEAVGMWDLPAMRLRGKRLSSRACDDVVGSAAVVCALDEIVSRRIRADVRVLLTRAEEAAFIGALAACRKGSLGRRARIVAVETSRAQPGAGLGEGVVVRVGDRTRTFDASLTAHVSAVAEGLARRDRTFRYVRRLMPGGTCESTVYGLWGYAATGLCLPLANYHNQGPRGRIAPEQVHADDFASLVRLLVALAAERSTPAGTDAALKRRLRALLARRGRRL